MNTQIELSEVIYQILKCLYDSNINIAYVYDDKEDTIRFTTNTNAENAIEVSMYDLVGVIIEELVPVMALDVNASRFLETIRKCDEQKTV